MWLYAFHINLKILQKQIVWSKRCAPQNSGELLHSVAVIHLSLIVLPSWQQTEEDLTEWLEGAGGAIGDRKGSAAHCGVNSIAWGSAASLWAPGAVLRCLHEAGIARPISQGADSDWPITWGWWQNTLFNHVHLHFLYGTVMCISTFTSLHTVIWPT